MAIGTAFVIPTLAVELWLLIGISIKSKLAPGTVKIPTIHRTIHGFHRMLQNPYAFARLESLQIYDGSLKF